MVRNQYLFSDIAQILKGEILNAPDDHSEIHDLLIDSRKLIAPEGCLFFALISKRNDGHKYLEDLYDQGVRNFVVQRAPENLPSFPEANIIRVKDTLRALQLLASEHRKQFDIPVIGITGSNGKTIVKEWLYQLMSSDKNIVRSPRSYNSQIGVPLSVWLMNPSNEIAIFEAGISEPDEMEHLQAVIQPTIGIFTNLGHAHDENFINRLQKSGEKLNLFTQVDTLIYCTDQKELQEGILKTGLLRKINVFTWSRHEDADLKIIRCQHNHHSTEISGIYRENTISISIPFTDEASADNAIHCWSALLYLGYDNEVIAGRMKSLQPVAMRLEMKEGINNCTLINDSYSNDIDSLSIALDFLNQQKQHKKKTAILSDILQSGRSDRYLYNEIGKLLARKDVEQVIGIGEAISKQSGSFSMKKAFFKDTDDFLNSYSFSSFSNECILVKGARVFEFERIIEQLQQKTHETILEINLNAVVHNLNYYRSKLKPGVKLMAMVKAFSYGSGSYEIANTLQFHQADYLTVAYADEGVELRKAGITLPIMVMNPDEQGFDSMFKYGLEPEVYSMRILNMLNNAIQQHNPAPGPVGIHVKIDTGMHRLGFDPGEVDDLIRNLKGNSHIEVRSVFSHLAGADDPALDDFTHHQIETLKKTSEKIQKAFDYPILRHIDNTAGITRFPEAQFDMVRLGIGLYGIAPLAPEQENLQNVSTLQTVISQIKHIPADDTVGYNRKWKAKIDTTIGIIPIGYADGLNRRLGNGAGKLLVNGNIVPIVGNICMDMCMVDITGIDAAEGDEVIVFGAGMPITELSGAIGTIPYELLTAISRRVKRIYFEE
ncbi:MAG TPA: bifunctional UDP-N-acetylmuramoyl-tripeptide:D-alanyl-D-alanine ligase/alanine racemase [Bacteroidales bacterium]|nr:bifunctional UDP-N-acetylmuramoyl-tripeptide:D-alanyl-D-alanine ligase/alanine racemase [Bacteroidales bacterium]HPT03392.1 bifunctional UDP-N-acetylmuramoyl-tripeptide:D-alanyl-D-alanine ligase/alanine racemase [Bacteroidales bacterium]